MLGVGSYRDVVDLWFLSCTGINLGRGYLRQHHADWHADPGETRVMVIPCGTPQRVIASDRAHIPDRGFECQLGPDVPTRHSVVVRLGRQTDRRVATAAVGVGDLPGTQSVGQDGRQVDQG